MRSQASSPLGTMLPALLVLLACDRHVSHPLPPRPAPMTTAAPALRADDPLLADYRALGLPLPPPQALLVRWESTGFMVLADGTRRRLAYLGFELPAEGGEKVLLMGTERFTPSGSGHLVPVSPGPEAADGIEGEWRSEPFETNAALATAMQARARGWDGLAARLLEVAARTSAGHHFSIFFQPAGTPPRRALAMLARAHDANQLTAPGSDRIAIASRIEASIALGPPVDNIDLGPFLSSLREAARPTGATPESIEAKIDALCEVTGAPHEAPQFLRIVELGYAAVPALIAHLGDARITRAVVAGFNNFPTYNARLNDIASDLLQGLAGEDLGRDWLRRQQGHVVERARAQAWWAEAQRVGEEAYLVAHALPADPRAAFPYGIVLHALAHRHPWRLADVYKAALSRPAMDSNAITGAIADSALPDAEKRRLLLAGADRPELKHRFAALRSLRPLDPAAYARVLARSLDSMPPTPKGAYWSAPEAVASRLAAETPAPEVWAALLRYARRADVGIRMELIGTLAYTYLGDRQRRERLSFLARFLDDPSAPDVSKDPEKWNGPRQGFTRPGLTVRDLAAMTIAEVLKMPARPEDGWTRLEWDALRAKVKQAITDLP